MSRYDGPSYFKKNHPKIKPLHSTNKVPKEKKKVSWADQDDYFKRDHEDTIPDRIQTRTDLQKKALEYMQTPPAQSQRKAVRPEPKAARASDDSTYRFRRKEIPDSLQKLDGWKTHTPNQALIAKVEKRLEKETNTYLLFEEYLAPEVAEVLEATEQAEQEEQAQQVEKETQKESMDTESATKSDPQKAKARPNKKRSTKRPAIKTGEHPMFDKQTKQKAERVQEDLKQTMIKPNAGLHRSLGKIIAEDQEALKNGKSNLGSLFSDDD